MILLSEREWKRIYSLIKQEYKSTPSVFLIRERMRETLGFTDRRHQRWDKETHMYIVEFYLDFYDESKETFFRLKYQ